MSDEYGHLGWIKKAFWQGSLDFSWLSILLLLLAIVSKTVCKWTFYNRLHLTNEGYESAAFVKEFDSVPFVYQKHTHRHWSENKRFRRDFRDLSTWKTFPTKWINICEDLTKSCRFYGSNFLKLTRSFNAFIPSPRPHFKGKQLHSFA